MKEEETVAPFDTKCCDACQCGGGCRFAQAALDQDDTSLQSGHAVGWDGCPSCFGCAGCTATDGDCCSDCSYDSVFHSSALPGGGTAVGNTYGNQVCNCEGHTCTKEVNRDG